MTAQLTYPRITDPAPAVTAAPRRRPSWFAAFWRWHFYASFLVVPVLAMLAATGLIYLFRFQLEPALNPSVMTVAAPPAGTAMRSYDSQLRAVTEALTAEGRTGATVASMTEPLDPDRPTRFTVSLADETSRDYYVDPYEAVVLGSVDPERTLSGAAIRLHGDLFVGPMGDYVIEVASCWAIVMALTGYYLVVKGHRARRRLRLAARAERLTREGAAARTMVDARLRSAHSVGGAVIGVALLGLLVSGLPWTAFWGENAQQLASRSGTSFWSADEGGLSSPTSTLDKSLPHSHAQDIPWALGNDERPTSDAGTGREVANLDTAVVVAERQGLHRPLTVVLPQGEDGVFSAISYAFEAPSQERTVHIDQYGGDVVAQYGYDNYPLLAKTVSHAIALHEGRHFGTVNMIGSAALCVTILFVCISGPVMWWRRRPKNKTLGAPRARLPLKSTPFLLIAMIGLAVLLPLFGLSLLAVLALDHLVLRRVPALSAWFSVKA